MKFIVVAVGHRMPEWIRSGFDDYARRMPREARLSLEQIRPAERSGGSGTAALNRVLEMEHGRIMKVLPARCRTVVLDERGTALSTRQFASRIESWRHAGSDVAFVIGGAGGTAPALKEKADFLWSLSTLTLPHGLARVVLAEQLYRAISLLRGHPYHRE
ncbi:MAG: 23S rRNA (pseudouridine(1915)-N(3))-methyltransferase RlmH [Betaproteobacteria bacterium]